MLKEIVTYIDFDGKEHTEELHFNLTASEVTMLELEGSGGSLHEQIQAIVEARRREDGATVAKILKKVILKAYGQKSEDGRRFVKNEEMREAFSQTNAFDDLFMKLLFNDEACVAFINGIVPPQNELQKFNK
jgi:hypothetical protein